MSRDKPRTGVNPSLEFESSCRKDRLRILEVAKRLYELVLVIPIELQNYATTIPSNLLIQDRMHDYDVA